VLDRVGSRERERTAEGTLEPLGERSKRSARAFTLLDTGGGERADGVGEAGPETERGVERKGARVVCAAVLAVVPAVGGRERGAADVSVGGEAAL
jgi:hypothetical protein